MKSSSQATALLSPVVNPSELPPTAWTVEHYFADDVEEYGSSWTAEAAEEEAYHCQPFEVRCKCGTWGCGSQWLLESVGWHLSIFGEVCPQCTQRSIDLGGRPEWVL